MAKNTYTNSKDSICMFSYNSRGLAKINRICVTYLCSIPIIIIQFSATRKIFYLKVIDIKSNNVFRTQRIFLQKKLSKIHWEGRPMNGMFIAVANDITENVLDVSPNHWRVQAITLKANNNRILNHKYVFPTDRRTTNFDTTELQTTLSAISDVLNANDFDNIVWAGDINADFGRRTKFTGIIEDFVSEKLLIKSWDIYKIDFSTFI